MNTQTKIKVIIAEDHTLFADGLEQILASENEFEIIAKVNNGKSLLQVLNSLTPDLILLDISMPYITGTDAAIRIRKNMPEAKIIFLSMHYDKKVTEFAHENNINGYLIKTIGAADLKKALHMVINGGEAFILPEHSNKPGFNNETDEIILNYKISQREFEIIELLKAGKNTKQISADLGLSFYTIETHRKNILKKMGVKNVAEMVAIISNNKPFNYVNLQDGW